MTTTKLPFVEWLNFFFFLKELSWIETHNAIPAAQWVAGRHNSLVAGYDTAMGNFSQGIITTAVYVEEVLWWYPWRGHQVARGDR